VMFLFENNELNISISKIHFCYLDENRQSNFLFSYFSFHLNLFLFCLLFRFGGMAGLGLREN